MNANPRKMVLPVMLATKTCPRISKLIVSTIPVAKVSNNNAMIVERSETGEATATCGGGFAQQTVPGRYSRGVRSSEVMVLIRVTNQRA